MRAMHRMVTFGTLCAALALCLASTATAAKGPPPSIDDLHNTYWIGTSSGTAYDVDAGTTQPWGKHTDSWQIDKIDATTVAWTLSFPGFGSRWHYENGCMVTGSEAAAGTPPGSAGSFYFIVTGAPGKMKMTGQYIYYDVDGADRILRVVQFSAKQVSGP